MRIACKCVRFKPEAVDLRLDRGSGLSQKNVEFECLKPTAHTSVAVCVVLLHRAFGGLNRITVKSIPNLHFTRDLRVHAREIARRNCVIGTELNALAFDRRSIVRFSNCPLLTLVREAAAMQGRRYLLAIVMPSHLLL